VPLGRDSELDLIRIDGCPREIEKRDCEQIQNYFKDQIGHENSYDLAVRKYRDYKRNGIEFLIIYIGKCQRRNQIHKWLIQKGIKLHRKTYRIEQDMYQTKLYFA
jgi:hypothetical protein